MRFNNKNVILPTPVVYPGLKFTSNGNSTISWSKNAGSAPAVNLQYSLNNGVTWVEWDMTTINLSNGETICFKGNNTAFASADTGRYNIFVFNGSISASGNIMSILDNGTCTQLSLPTAAFANLFRFSTGLVDISKLTLPATTLGEYCYHCTFLGTSITEIPVLPATTLTSYCYNNMFNLCTNLTRVTADKMPATTLADHCYRQMFSGCSSLNYIECGASNISATGCLENWLGGVSATGDFYNLGGVTYPSGDSGIPSGWTEHTSL